MGVGFADELAFLDSLAGADEHADDAETTKPSVKEEIPENIPEEQLRPGNAAGNASASKIDTTAELELLNALAGEAGIKVETKATIDENKPDVVSRDNSSVAGPSGASGPSAVPLNAASEVKDDVKVEIKPDEEDEEETYERDATQLLGSFAEVKEETEEEQLSAEELMKQFMDEMRVVDRDNEVVRVLSAFKLNPYEKLNLRFTATEAEVKKAYRKISLLIHPDKCKHPRAADAFDVIGDAQAEILDSARREAVLRVLEYAREAVREARRKATKHDSAVRLAASIHADGRAGVEREWEETEDFHEKWRIKAQDVLARAAFRKLKLAKRMREEEDRVEKEEKVEFEKRKKARQEKKDFHQTRNNRINSWRDYQKSGKKVAGTKAPTTKTWDSDKSYVQRATTEQFVGNYRKRHPK